VLAASGAALPASGSQAAKTQFRVVSATATATLTFHTQTSDQSSVANGKVTLLARAKKAGKGSLPGLAGVPLKGKVSERVKTRRRSSSTSQYEELTCAKTRKVVGRGGVRLGRVGSKVRVRWAFPQAKPRFCHGPSAAKRVTQLMKRLYPASRFSAAKVTVVLKGFKTSVAGTRKVTYRWRATIKLVRS
jgi:hypothetical protein